MPAFLDKTVVKLGLAVTLILACIAFYKWQHDVIFQAGVDSQIAVQAKANEAADKAFTLELGKALDESKTAKANAAKLQGKINEIERDYRRISKIAKNSECKALGADTFEWWNGILKEPTK